MATNEHEHENTTAGESHYLPRGKIPGETQQPRCSRGLHSQQLQFALVLKR